MYKKVIIHTDASNIKNSNHCKTASIIEYEDTISTTVDFCNSKISQAELLAVLNSLLKIEKDYSAQDLIIEVYTDHLPNSKLIQSIILFYANRKNENFDKINKILIRKGFTWEDIDIINRITKNNYLFIIWIPRKENRFADKLSKE